MSAEPIKTSEDVSADADFQAFLNESLSDEESHPNVAGGIAESEEMSSVWWADDTSKDSLAGPISTGKKRSSFMKSSAISEDTNPQGGGPTSSQFLASDSTIREEQYKPVNVNPDKQYDQDLAELSENTEVSDTPMDLSHADSNPIMHSTLLTDSKNTQSTVKTSQNQDEHNYSEENSYESDHFENDQSVKGQSSDQPIAQQGGSSEQPSSGMPSIPTAHSNLLSQVQLSDTGSLDLTLQGKPNMSLSAQRLQGSVAPGASSRGLPIETSITELDEDASTSYAKKAQSDQTPSGSAVDNKAVVAAMSNYVSNDASDAVAGVITSQDRPSDTSNSKTMPELIAEMEALDSQELNDLKTVTPPSVSRDGTNTTSRFAKSPYRPSSSQRTAKVRSTGVNFNPIQEPSPAQDEKVSRIRSSPHSAMRSSVSKIPLYSHVRSSGYGNPLTYMPMMSRGSTTLSSMSSMSRFNKKAAGNYRQEDYRHRYDQVEYSIGSVYHIGQEERGEAARGKQYMGATLNKNAESQTIPDNMGINNDHWRLLWSECNSQVNDLRKKLSETEVVLNHEQNKAKHATESLNRIRKTMQASKKGSTSENELNSRISLLERMLSETQSSNKDLMVKVKDLETENLLLLDAPQNELAVAIAEAERLKKSEESLKMHLGEKIRQFDVETKRLNEELRKAHQSEADAELRSAQLKESLETLDRQKLELEIKVESMQERLASKEVAQANLKLKTIASPIKNVQGQQVSQSPKKGENLEVIEENKRLQAALSLAETEISRLKDYQAQLLLKESRHQFSASPTKVVEIADSNKVRSLELAIKELESILREKHPGSVPVAVLDSAAAENSKNMERIRTLEARCQQLEMEKLQLPRANEKSYQASAFASPVDETDERLQILREHISDQDVILNKIRNEANDLKAAKLADQAEIVRLKGALAIFEKRDSTASPLHKQDEVLQTLLRERAMALKSESSLKAEVFELRRRLEGYEQRIRELMDQLADARSEHSPERRLFERLLDRLSEMERRFQRREEVIRELRMASVLGETQAVNKNKDNHLPNQPQMDPVFLRSELDKLVRELHELRSKTGQQDSSRKADIHTSFN